MENWKNAKEKWKNCRMLKMQSLERLCRKRDMVALTVPYKFSFHFFKKRLDKTPSPCYNSKAF